MGRSGALLVGAAVALTMWIGITMWWSIVGDRSWDAFNKAVAYCAFLGLGVMLAAVGRRFGARLAASMLSVVIGATLVWALIAKAVPALDPEGDRVARLREPVGYWNALALLADIALVLGLWLGTAREHRRGIRVAGALLVYAATLALLLTLSRTGIVGRRARARALVRRRTASAWGAGCCSRLLPGPAIVVGAWAFTRPALTEDVATRSDRVADGAVFGALALAGALARRRLSSASGFGDLSTRRRAGASDAV